MLATAVSGLLCLGSVGLAQSSEQFPYIGQVTGDRVNVRSGPDTNYYVTTRLNAGQQVTVVGEQFGWLKIKPPAGSFCLIAKEFVDLDREGSGVVSRDHVNVRAGSELSARTLPIMQLDKGAVVRIIGQDARGYYKIAPPAGAYLWISKQFVRRVEAAQPARPAEPTPTTQPVATQPVRAAASRPAPAGRYQRLLDALEAELQRATSGKPFEEWDLQPFVKRYQEIAQQQLEQVPRLFARQRLRILQDRIELQEALRRIRRQREQLEDQRRVLLQQRSALRASMAAAFEPFDAQGELRKSWAFDAPGLPKRYRLVDPARDRTVAYVEFTDGSGLEPTAYLGRYVGIRAARKTLEGLIPILVPAEIVVLEPPTQAETPTVATAPATRPGGGD